jgi:DHA1 family inner membrane transport protein
MPGRGVGFGRNCASVRPWILVTTPRHPGLAVGALILGGIAIGVTEFVSMGLLPDVAQDFLVSIPQAGHGISLYAAGVVIGAPVLAAVGARLPRKGLLLALTAVIIVGNALTALAPTFDILLASRFLAGMPHGAFFGVASLVAVDMADRGRAVGRVMLGIPIANLAGVPLATWMGQQLGWRSAYWSVAVLAALTLALVAAYAPKTPRDDGATVMRELKEFARLQVLLTLLVGAIGFGGMFAMLSYIAPVVTDVTGLPARAVPAFMLSFGIGGLVGTWVAGRVVDWSILRAIAIGCVGMAVSLAAFALTAQWAVPAWIGVFLTAGLGSFLVVGLQLRLMEVAGEAQTLGAAGNHAALNTANALGAWIGGVVIAGGFGLLAPSWVGVGLCLLGAAVLALSIVLHRRSLAAAAA